MPKCTGKVHIFLTRACIEIWYGGKKYTERSRGQGWKEDGTEFLGIMFEGILESGHGERCI